MSFINKIKKQNAKYIFALSYIIDDKLFDSFFCLLSTYSVMRTRYSVGYGVIGIAAVHPVMFHHFLRLLPWFSSNLVDCRPDGHTLENFADISYLKEQSFLHRIRDVCTL